MQIKTQIAQYQDQVLRFMRRLNDVRFAGQLLFVVIVLMISWSGVKTIQTNYNLQKQISTLKQQNSVQKLTNTNLSLQNQYYNTDQYLELSARQNFGLAATGEKEVIVPASVAMAYTVDLPDSTAQEPAQAKPSGFQRNFQAWTNFFLHRQSVD